MNNETELLFKAFNLQQFDDAFQYGGDIHAKLLTDHQHDGDNLLNILAAKFKSFEEFKTLVDKYPFTDSDICCAISIYAFELLQGHYEIKENYERNIKHLKNYYKLKNLHGI
jgi:hypothetical protein